MRSLLIREIYCNQTFWCLHISVLPSKFFEISFVLQFKRENIVSGTLFTRLRPGAIFVAKTFFFSNTHCSCSNCLLVCTPRKQFWETIIPQHQWFSVCTALYTLHKQTTETYSLETSSVTVPVVALSLQRFRFKVPPCISRPTETLKNKNLKNIVYLFIFFTFS